MVNRQSWSSLVAREDVLRSSRAELVSPSPVFCRLCNLDGSRCLFNGARVSSTREWVRSSGHAVLRRVEAQSVLVIRRDGSSLALYFRAQPSCVSDFQWVRWKEKTANWWSVLEPGSVFQREALAWGHCAGRVGRASFMHLEHERMGAALTKKVSRSHSLERARGCCSEPLVEMWQLLTCLCVCAVSDPLGVSRNPSHPSVWSRNKVRQSSPRELLAPVDSCPAHRSPLCPAPSLRRGGSVSKEMRLDKVSQQDSNPGLLTHWLGSFFRNPHPHTVLPPHSWTDSNSCALRF